MTPRTAYRWSVACFLVAAYIGLGYLLQHADTALPWIYRIGLTAATVVPVVFVGIYTVFGWRGAVSAKWWRNALGTALVVAALSLVPIAGPLAYVFWADGGNLTSSWLAWVEVSGPCVSATAWLWLCVLWVQIRRAAMAAASEEGPAAD